MTCRLFLTPDSSSNKALIVLLDLLVEGIKFHVNPLNGNIAHREGVIDTR